MSNLQMRLITALIFGIITLIITFIGGMWFSIFSFIIAFFVFSEWQNITKQKQTSLTIVLGILFYWIIFVLMLVKVDIIIVFSSIFLFSFILGLLSLKNYGWVAGGFLYASISALTLSLLRGDEPMGFGVIIFLFSIVWGTDIGAYFNGRAIGGPKLAPKISPNKTWSGAIGGAAIGVAAGMLVVLLLMKNSLVSGIISYGILIPLLTLVLSIISQLGDIGESWIKRHFGVKDSGTLLPGHGGFMDRVDGLIPAAILLYIIGATAADPRVPANLFNFL